MSISPKSPPRAIFTVKNALSSLGWETGIRLVSMASSLFVGLWVARYLGAAQFGVLAYAIAPAYLFAGIAHLGLQEVVVRRLVDHPDQEARILGSAFVLRLAGGAVFAAVLVGFALLASDTAVKFWMILGIGSAQLLQTLGIAGTRYRANLYFRPLAITRFCVITVSAGLKITLILTGAPVAAFVLPAAIDVSAGTGLGWIPYVLAKRSIFAWRFCPHQAKALWQLAWPLAVAAVLSEGVMRVDAIMLGRMVSDSAVGVYAAATRLMDALYLLPVALAGVFLPLLADAKNRSADAFAGRVRELGGTMVWGAVAASVPVGLLAPWIVAIAYGAGDASAANFSENGFSGSVAVLQVHVLTLVIVALEVARTQVLLSHGLTRLLMVAGALVLGVNMALNAAFIPLYGPVGAAWASVLARLCGAVFMSLVAKECRDFHRHVVLGTVRGAVWGVTCGPGVLRRLF